MIRMKNSLILIILLFITFSCKENASKNRQDNISKKNVLDNVNNKEAEFQEIGLKCSGDEYNARECSNKKEKVSISFSQQAINFSIDRASFDDYDVVRLGDLGYRAYLYGNTQNKVIIIDSFLENGHLFYIYFYDKTGLKFLGKKEVTMTDESVVIDKIKISQIKNELIVFIGKGIENLKFNIDKGIDLNAKAKVSVNKIMNQNLLAPENVTNKLIFTKDSSNKLQINTEILNYIQTHTTATNNAYVIALQKYVTDQIISFYDDGERHWTEEQLIKIIAYASNTTDPLHKKLWKESPEHWHRGMWGNILSFCYVVYPKTLWVKLQAQLKKENYYNLPNVKEMMSYATEFDRFGPP